MRRFWQDARPRVVYPADVFRAAREESDQWLRPGRYIIGEIRADTLLNDIKWIKNEARKLDADAITAPERKRDGFTYCYAVKYK